MTWGVLLVLLLACLVAARIAPRPRQRLLGAVGGCLIALLMGFMLAISLAVAAIGAAWDGARSHPWLTLAVLVLFLVLLAGRPGRRRRPMASGQPPAPPAPVTASGEDLSGYLRRRKDQIVDGRISG